MIERNTEFDPFASIYNRFWGAEYHEQALPIVERLLLSRLEPGARVLDVCCGNGKFTRRVQDLGFRLWGVDASERMIDFAKTNAPGAELRVTDARAFELGQRFEAAYSVFESLNHVPDLAGLEQAFRCVRGHLGKGAPFLFDLNREEAFETYWNDTHAIVEPETVCALRSRYDAGRRIAQCDITVFELAEGWQRNDFSVRQTFHPIADVHDALLRVGFQSVTLYDSRDVGMTGEIAYARTFFLAVS